MKRMLHDESVDPELRALLEEGSLPRGPSAAELQTLVTQAPVAAGLGAGGALSLTAVGASAGSASIALAAALIAASGPEAPSFLSSRGEESLPTQSPSETPTVEPREGTPRLEAKDVETAQAKVALAEPEHSRLLQEPRQGAADASPKTLAPPRAPRPKRRRARRRPPPAPPLSAANAGPESEERTRGAVTEVPEEIGRQEAPKASALEKRRSEVELIDLARKWVHRRPAQALRFLREHLMYFPDGVLAEERDYLLAQCAATLGLEQVRDDAVRRLRARVPPSTYLHQLEKR